MTTVARGTLKPRLNKAGDKLLCGSCGREPLLLQRFQRSGEPYDPPFWYLPAHFTVIDILPSDTSPDLDGLTLEELGDWVHHPDGFSAAQDARIRFRLDEIKVWMYLDTASRAVWGVSRSGEGRRRHAAAATDGGWAWDPREARNARRRLSESRGTDRTDRSRGRATGWSSYTSATLPTNVMCPRGCGINRVERPPCE
jgi:hypothetical protein